MRLVIRLTLLAALLAIVSRVKAADPLTILPLGDSITYGYPGTNAGYRGPLYSLLTNVTTNFQFVGSSTNAWQISKLPKTQWSNEGHGSYAIDNVFTNLDGLDNSVYATYGGSDRNPNGGHWLDGIASGPNARNPLFPDIILLLIGANERDTPTGAEARLDRLILKLVTLRPGAEILLARIPPIIDTTAHRTFVTNYNRSVDAVIAKYAIDHNVSDVDLNSGFPANGLSSDGLHPSDSGYTWIANRWFTKITEQPKLQTRLNSQSVEISWPRTHRGWTLESLSSPSGVNSAPWQQLASPTNAITTPPTSDLPTFFRMQFH